MTDNQDPQIPNNSGDEGSTPTQLPAPEATPNSASSGLPTPDNTNEIQTLLGSAQAASHPDAAMASNTDDAQQTEPLAEIPQNAAYTADAMDGASQAAPTQQLYPTTPLPPEGVAQVQDPSNQPGFPQTQISSQTQPLPQTPQGPQTAGYESLGLDPAAMPTAGGAGGSGASGDGSTSAHGNEEGKHRLVVPLVSALLVGGLLGGGAGAGVAVWAQNQNSATPVSASSDNQSIVNNTGSVTSVTAAVVKASPSAVTISAQTSSGESGTGSGVVLSKDGYVLTNAHVATLDGATTNATLSVTTSNNQVLKAKLVGYDANSDLAVLKVDADNLTPATFADSNKLNVGDSVVAIGAPLGLSNTVTDGIISTLHRGITVQSSAVDDSQSQGDANQGDSSDPFKFWGYGDGQNNQSSSSAASVYLSVIQTDAAINPGNSGGPLVNSDGHVVGINVAIATASSNSSSSSSSGSIGVGFAIPSSFAKRVANEIIENGKASHGLLGATISDATSTSAYAGGQIETVIANGAAANAGIKAGDVVTAIDNSKISNATDLTALVRQYAAGSKVTITYARDGKLYKTTATLGSLADATK